MKLLSFYRALTASVAPTILLAVASPALADFSNTQLETFDGTTIDTTHYSQVRPDLMSQNNALFISAATTPGVVVEHVTTITQLAVGGSAKVQVMATARSSQDNFSQLVSLILTTADASNYYFDSYSLSADLTFAPPGSYVASYHSGGFGNGTGLAFNTFLNQNYFLQIDRLSDTSVHFAVFNSSNSLITQNTRSLPAYAGPLYVGVGALAVDAQFDNLQLSGNVVPEPASATLALLIGGALLLRRRSRAQ